MNLGWEDIDKQACGYKSQTSQTKFFGIKDDVLDKVETSTFSNAFIIKNFSWVENHKFKFQVWGSKIFFWANNGLHVSNALTINSIIHILKVVEDKT